MCYSEHVSAKYRKRPLIIRCSRCEKHIRAGVLIPQPVVNTKNWEGASPLSLCCAMGYADVAALLVEKCGADVNATDIVSTV
jgi:ankyrin repeat protein